MNYTHLTFGQRYHIDHGRRQPLGVGHCTQDRRSSQHRLSGTPTWQDVHERYRAAQADERAKVRSRISAANHPTKPAALWELISQWIGEQYAPEQTVGRLAPVGITIPVSVAAIYGFGTPVTSVLEAICTPTCAEPINVACGDPLLEECPPTAPPFAIAPRSFMSGCRRGIGKSIPYGAGAAICAAC